MPIATQSIRQIIAAAPSATAVFERFEIDLCSQADNELERVCAELQLSVEQLLEKIADAEAQAHGRTVPDVETFSLTRLIQLIVRTHHQTVRRELPPLAELSKRIAAKHGAIAPHYRVISNLILQLRDEMFVHVGKEEAMLFPYIVRLEEAMEARPALPYAGFRFVAQPISVMVREHESFEALVAELRKLTDGFVPPEWACPRNMAFHANLAAVESDLLQHVHLENDLLFPRAIALESKLKERS